MALNNGFNSQTSSVSLNDISHTVANADVQAQLDDKRSSRSLSWNSICGFFRLVLRRVWQMRQPDAVKIAIDCAFIAIAAGWTWLVAYSQVPNPGSPLPFMTTVLVARLFIYFPLRLYRHSWLHVSRHEVFWLAVSALLGPFAIAAVFAVLPDPYTLSALVRPHLILATEPALYLLMLCLARLTARTLYSNSQKECSHRLLIIGAGATGRALAFQIQETTDDYQIVGFVDDDPRLRRRQIRGVPVLGACQDLVRLANASRANELVIAISSLKPERLREIIAFCSETALPVRMLPPLKELLGKKDNLRALREVSMEDLLPRPAIDLDRSALSKYLSGKAVLVTGGGGSIGAELCRQVLAAGAERLLVLGRGENSVFEIVQELNELCQEYNDPSGLDRVDAKPSCNERKTQCEIIPVICDVRDRVGLDEVFQTFKPDVVFHAAAHKHVPLMEQYPCEAVKNNVIGTLNVVQLAVESSVERFVMVSTDKAVEPTNVMGTTKRIGEMIVKAYASHYNANMVCVRFGNVLGSRGSVVPTMKRQIKKGLPVTVTDVDMVRYFMTIPEAVQLILQAGAVGGCGDVFVLNMGHPVRILDLAYDLIRLSGLVPEQDVQVNIIGKRPGEKMYEDLFTARENEIAQKSEHFTVASPYQVAISDLLLKINKLNDVSVQGNRNEIVSLLCDLVPEFQPENRLIVNQNQTSAEVVQAQINNFDLLGSPAQSTLIFDTANNKIL